MHYFTPERWVSLQNVADERAFYTAQEEWQRAVAAYREALSRVLPGVPHPLRRFAEHECLHDATLLAAWQGRTRLYLLLRPDPPAARLVLLTYTLVEPPQVTTAALPPEYRTEGARWMYDEIGVEREGPSDNPAVGVFTHSVLLSNGWEVRLRFRQFGYSRPDALFPVPDTHPIQSLSALSQSA
jgi:hypothetical protein